MLPEQSGVSSVKVAQNSIFLGDLVSSVVSGDAAPAAFQRSYVWSADDVESFFSSLLIGLPVGSVLTWTPFGAADISEVSRGRLGPIETAGAEHSLLLDGQNRLATFAWAMWSGLNEVPAYPDIPYSDSEKETWMSGRALMADYEQKAVLFSDSPDVTSTAIPVAYLIDSRRTMAHLRENDPSSGFSDEALNWWIDDVQNSIRSAKIIQTDLERASVEEARSAFLRIAKAGVVMSEEDFDRAVSWSAERSLKGL